VTHTYDDVLRHITNYLHHRLEGSPLVTANSHFTQELHVDSLQVFEIVGELEEKYQVIIPLELLFKQRIQTVAQLVDEVMHLLEKT